MDWQPWETAPKDGKPFLAAWANSPSVDYLLQPVRWQNGHFLHTWDHGALSGTPTHWMPLPPPPTAAE